MRKVLLILGMAFCHPAVWAAGPVKINGNVEGLPEGGRAELWLGALHTDSDPLATATVSGGTFALEYPIDEARLFYLRFDGGGTHFLLAPGDEISITGTASQPVVTGSALNGEYIEKFVIPREEMSRRHSEIQRNGATAEADREFFADMGAMLDKAVADNADTFWAPLLLLSHTAYLTPENERHYNMFSDAVKNSFYGRLVHSEVFGRTGTAPAFAAKDAAGAEYTLAELLAGGHHVLVDFWASWCGPCRRFVPTLKELAAQYADRGLVVVSISTDRDPAAWRKALGEEKMPWLNLLDESGISAEYGVTGIPSIFLIAPDGNIVFGKQNGQSVVDKLAEVF
jgi:thiol-disulfide isomerase/thioredoxin